MADQEYKLLDKLTTEIADLERKLADKRVAAREDLLRVVAERDELPVPALHENEHYPLKSWECSVDELRTLLDTTIALSCPGVEILSAARIGDAAVELRVKGGGVTFDVSVNEDFQVHTSKELAAHAELGALADVCASSLRALLVGLSEYGELLASRASVLDSLASTREDVSTGADYVEARRDDGSVLRLLWTCSFKHRMGHEDLRYEVLRPIIEMHKDDEDVTAAFTKLCARRGFARSLNDALDSFLS